MRNSFSNDLVCPYCHGNLLIAEQPWNPDVQSIVNATLRCQCCASTFPVIGSIPRFVPASNYAESFGFEWAKHTRTQLDSANGTTISRDRFFRETGWNKSLVGQRILEVGCGAGRFTEIALSTGADIVSLDYSMSVDVALMNNGNNPYLNLLQADLFNLPLRQSSFDKIFCFGVIQFTPDVERAFDCLIPFLKPGGAIVVDTFANTFEYYFTPRRYLRPITSRLPHRQLYALIATAVPVLMPIKAALRMGIPKAGRHLDRVIQVGGHVGWFKMPWKLHLEWSKLDTFNMLAPRYEQPQRVDTVRSWFQNHQLENVEVGIATPGMIVGRGTKPPPWSLRVT